VEGIRPTVAWELKEIGFRGTAGGDFSAADLSAPRDCILFLDPPDVPRRGGGSGLLSKRGSGPFSVTLGLGIQSGSSSIEKGLDLR
jgi:hypothetical protein